MTTWDDKPNDYEHALAVIEQLRFELKAKSYEIKIADAAIERLQALVKKMGALAVPGF